MVCRDERRQRAANLKNLLDQPDVSVAEKYRRVMEAYQVETEYGHVLVFGVTEGLQQAFRVFGRNDPVVGADHDLEIEVGHGLVVVEQRLQPSEGPRASDLGPHRVKSPQTGL